MRVVSLGVVAMGVLGCQPSAPAADAETGAPLSDGCWALEYGEPTTGLPSSDGTELPPGVVRIWTDSTFPNSQGLLQVEAAPGYTSPGGGMLSWISTQPDSVELTWAAATSSTHYRLEVFADSLRGTAWHHREVATPDDEPRQVRAHRVECASP